MFCPSPVPEFDYKAVQLWLRQNCWIDQRPAGECATTSFFIQAIFGWPVRDGNYHVWNISPGGNILDLTVGQYSRRHSTRLVHPTTVFDINNRRKLTYAMTSQWSYLTSNATKVWVNQRLHMTKDWVDRLHQQLPVSGNFGLSRRSLSIRVNRALRRLNCP